MEHVFRKKRRNLCVLKEGRVLNISQSLLSLTNSKYHRTTQGVHRTKQANRNIKQAFTGLCPSKMPLADLWYVGYARRLCPKPFTHVVIP